MNTVEDKNPGALSNLWYGRTPMHFAAQNGYIDVVKFIAETLDEVNPRDAQGLTPMHLAAFQGHQDVVKYLLDNTNGDKNPKTESGDVTPYKLAVTGGHADIAKLLEPYAN